jgi:hypothetical protein
MSRDHVDGDGLPLMGPDKLEKWRAEALRNLPSPEDWANLVAYLRWENELAQRRIQMPNVPEGFTAAERSLRVVILFLQRHPVLMCEKGIAPLIHLHGAMVDVASGTAPPLFQPKVKRTGRPRKGVRADVIQAFAARAMSELIEAGDSVPEAATKVANALRKGRPADLGNLEPKTVKNWRNRILAGIGDGASADAISLYKQPLPPEFGLTHRDVGENLLKQLSERGSEIG